MPNEAHVLLADDEEHIRRGLSQLLESEGYRVTCAGDGQEALEIFQGGASFDVLISDVKMPRLDGLALLSAVHEQAPDLPVIIITGHGDLDTAIEALRHGAYDFVTKPFEGEVVLAAVLRAQEKTRLRGEVLAAQKLAALGTLAAGVAHELNTPLNAIVAAAERLMKQMAEGRGQGAEGNGQSAIRNQKSEIHKYLDMIIRNGLRCAKIVQAVKSYARSGPLEWQECDLNAVVQDTLTLMEHGLQRDAGVQITVEADPALPRLRGDPGKLTQVFINLLNNAREAMPDGGEISLSLRRGDDGESVVATVADTGPGIPPEALARIFDPFFTTKPVGQGTGLGLSLVAGIVRDHHGTLAVESQPGQGATFIITLPMSPNGETPAVAVPAAGRYDD